MEISSVAEPSRGFFEMSCRAEDDLADRLCSLRTGDDLTVVGCKAAAFAARLPAQTRPCLRLDFATIRTVEAAIQTILDDLADIALARWPDWPPAWRRAAERLARAGRRPRFARVPAVTQFNALYATAGLPVLIVPIDPVRPDRAGVSITALEWARRHGSAAMALLAELPPAAPPWDRVLYGALTLAPSRPEPALARFVPPMPAGLRGSAVERRMRAALRADPILGILFEDEVTLRLDVLGFSPRVDLLWRDGKVVVELDGIEHERASTYAADRHRDYELLVAGYLVLRLTNAEVELDLARALEKIRRVVALRSGPA